LIDTTTLGLFVAAAAILLMTPGPAVLYIVARSVEHGRAAGIVSALGIQVGTLFHVAAAAFGVSAILVSSALAFSVLKYVGAAYLIYLGVRTLARKETEAAPDVPPRERSLLRIFVQGVVVNVLNPKTALFFLAFLPQFVNPARGAVAAQVLLLGLVFVFLGAFTDGTWALLAGSASGFLRSEGYAYDDRG
jgi:threonine/homoserine/homoserine lactone efflux protein